MSVAACKIWPIRMVKVYLLGAFVLVVEVDNGLEVVALDMHIDASTRHGFHQRLGIAGVLGNELDIARLIDGAILRAIAVALDARSA